MEVDDLNSPIEVVANNKRALETVENIENEPQSKRQKLFSAKQFRKQLNSSDKLIALKDFQLALSNPSKHDFILDYLKNGGNCLELLQILESDSAVPPSIVFDLVTKLLLGISAKHGQYYSSAYESCRYLINNYLPVVHKMLGMSSSKEERKVCLKLLTSMAAFSASLAKDILLNVKFHSANIELLTKHTGEKHSVRDHFVHFLTAFLVEGDAHTLSVLLEKSGLLTSIISGLQYDDADTVSIVITAMKNHILENPVVMKTTKMHVFNTAVVKDIVNLYNWKGPEGLKALEKNNKTTIEVDKFAKSKVSECVHDFLLVLCTSQKFGVIFRDPLVGLGKKNMNSLMYTVLDSLDRPWEHSYASELVIKICRSCPDLTKNMWTIVKPFLEPRLTEKWLKTMDFCLKLLDEVEPASIEFCAKDINPSQLAQIIEMLISPLPILRVLLAENQVYTSDIKQHILKLLHHMLEKMSSYLNSVHIWINHDKFLKVKQILTGYVTRNYPSSQQLLEEWQKVQSDENIDKVDKQSHLETILDILNTYKDIAPQLLYNLTSSTFDFKDFLLKLSKNTEDDVVDVETLQIKIIGIFVDIDSSYFLPKGEIFEYILPLLLRNYHGSKCEKIQAVLCQLLDNTGIFDSGSHEILIWINGIFNFNTFTDSFANDLVAILRDTYNNLLDYQQEVITFHKTTNMKNSKQLIESLLKMSRNDENITKLKQRQLSPALLGLLKHGSESKSMKKYMEIVLLNIFHNQTDISAMTSLVQNYELPSNILHYINSWNEGHPCLGKFKGTLTVFKDLCEIFLKQTLTGDILQQTAYPGFVMDVLRMSSFFFANLVKQGSIDDNHVNNVVSIVKFMMEKHIGCLQNTGLDYILAHPVIVNNFCKKSSELCTKAILEIVKMLKPALGSLDSYLHHYSDKVYQLIMKTFKSKHARQIDLNEYLEVFPLSYNNCTNIIEHLSGLSEVEDVDLLNYSLKRILQLCRDNSELPPLDKRHIRQISSFLCNLTKDNKDGLLSQILKNYLESYPSYITEIDKNLFSSILCQSDYNKETAELAIFLLNKDIQLLKYVEEHVDVVCDKKGLILPMLEVLADKNAPEKTLEQIYKKVEASIIKALQKPQKVGQHFTKDYNIYYLIEKFMPLEKCQLFAEKVQKFEVAEVFHAKLLECCYNKVLSETDPTDKQINNIIMTFVHLETALFKRKLESDEEVDKLTKLSIVFNKLLDKILSKADLPDISVTDSFKTFTKFALKFGVIGHNVLLMILRKLIGIFSKNLTQEDGSLLMEMLLSHSEFLNVVLGEHNETKLEVLLLIRCLYEKWNELMEKNHIAVILSAYRGMVTRCDRVVMKLLKLYESKPGQTHFYDFKPFLWGRAAAAHYSVRNQVGTTLTRQPKVSDVLGILKEELVKSTIINHPLKEGLHEVDEITDDVKSYDLKFLLPLFSHILAPEQQVKTYTFIRSGALSLTILGLACEDKEIRQASCHVLARLHFHLEARQSGKDNLLWIRFIEAICKGVAVLPEFRLNNFSATFFARMALILTNPKNLMYGPLSKYLSAKDELDFSTVPELYTMLFSCDVNYKEHRVFILEILRDGVKTDKDIVDFLKSMGYKLISELFSSCLSDSDCQLLIAEVIGAICRTSPLAVNILTENYSLLPQLKGMTSKLLQKESNANILVKLLDVLCDIAQTRCDKFSHQMIFDICLDIFESPLFSLLESDKNRTFDKIIRFVYAGSSESIRYNGKLLTQISETSTYSFYNYITTKVISK